MRRLAIPVLLIAILLLLPLVVTSSYYLRLINLALVFGLLAVSLNVVLGYAGQLSLGHAGLFGIGAYVSALATSGQSGALFWPAFAASGLVAGAVGLLIGFPALRLKGHYLALATLGFGEIMRNIFFNWREVTHGMDGIGNIPPPSLGFVDFGGDARFFYLGLLTLSVTILLVRRLERSKYGRMLAAIRDAELAAGAVGVNVPRQKVMAFFISAVLAGCAGSLYAHLTSYISPDVFVFDVSAQVLSMVLIGGIGTTMGPVLGAVVLTFLPEILRISKSYYQLIYGAGIAAMIIFFPGGLLGLARQLWGLFGAEKTVAPSARDDLDEEVAPVAVVPRTQPAGGGSAMLVADGVTKRFGGLTALSDLSLEVREGEIHALIGPNGSGKSTFINVASGIYRPTSGQISFLGAPIAGRKPWQIAGVGLARTFQNLRLFQSLSVLDNVLVGCRTEHPAGWLGVLSASELARSEDTRLRAIAESALAFVGLSRLRDHPIRTLPHEQQRIVEIARAIAMQPRLIMLDEPAAGMNPAEVERLILRIKRLRDSGMTILLVEHNMPLVMRLADRITVLNHGRRIAEGDPAAIRDNPEVIQAYLGHGTKKRLARYATA
ncbi:branched-chain amino acid ABC transporter ATP-binding protein/permease [Bradyrhizobium sp. NP1]|uniref:branched-chain amino acid ABC transporter ATP-binding protein/permease n=1 Tax=Bradyrhizobium sp. NP1 TaxID=3049772 RepID=UPI0025A62157|nr:branched-chain amino acid ABC transporter ATP-binding protein/permease [Bradyrhizobium sp. NP1]WJR80894.1 branched-chain amino acid ABC transporter ATP-binding protein/permease [Bradyrhizobium sp. NP1]